MTENMDSAGSGSPNLLLVEDDPAFANLLKWVLDGTMNVEVRERAEDVLELVDAGRTEVASAEHVEEPTALGARVGGWFNGPVRFFGTESRTRVAPSRRDGKREGLGASGVVGTHVTGTTRSSRVDESSVIHLASRPDGSSAYVLRSQNGVRVSVNSGGVISRLDAALILETFVQAFLLLSFSNIVMRFVAFTLLGTKSRVHKEFGEHEVEYEREYAYEYQD